jgi:hypothetical protein
MSNPITLNKLTDAALSEMESELIATFTEKRKMELSVDSVKELADLRNEIKAVQAERAARADLAAQAAEIEADLAAASEPAPEPEKVELAADEKTDEPEAEKVEEPKVEEAVTAAITPDGLDAPEDRQPAFVKPSFAIVAGADIPQMPAGTALPDLRAVAEAMVERRDTFRGLDKVGDGDRAIVATVKADFPEERTIRRGGSYDENKAKIDALVAALNAGADPKALVASGGICAPAEPYYGLQNLSAADRPVRDGLPVFGADRGKIVFMSPPHIADTANAVGIRTAAADASGYPPQPAKTPLRVTCGAENNVAVQAIYRHLIFGNFMARTYPEQVETWLALTIAEHARVAETALLDGIAAASTAVTTAASYGATRSLLARIDEAVAGMRYRLRASRSTKFRVLLPDFAKELLRADLVRQQFPGAQDSASIPDSAIMEWFSVRGVNPTFYLDTPTGAGQSFAAQSGGALNEFPDTLVWFLFPEGSFLFLDGGTLDLGLVRDSTLNSTNDYSVFAETFENVAFVGLESLKITSTVCPSGAGPTGATIYAC